MKTILLIIIVIAAVAVSSATTYIIVPKQSASFYPNWLENNIAAAHKIVDSDIPIIGVDVDEKIAILTIYMADENSKKYVQEIDDLLDVPFDILSETQSRELSCLKTYKDIREISRTHGAATAEWHIIRHQMHFVNEYVELKCPDFSDLDSMKDNLKRYAFVSIPHGASLEGRTSLIPEEITVVLGINNTVTWINEDDVAHEIASDHSQSWGSTGVLKPGNAASVTFDHAGIFTYHDQPHPWITGKVIVLENSSFD